MSSSEPAGGGGPGGDVERTFLRQHGLDDDWTVRFTADRGRAREMASQYRDAGYDVRIVSLFPDDSTPEDPSHEPPADPDPGPLGQGETETCAPCLAGMCVLLTRRRAGRETRPGPDDGLVYE